MVRARVKRICVHLKAGQDRWGKRGYVYSVWPWQHQRMGLRKKTGVLYQYSGEVIWRRRRSRRTDEEETAGSAQWLPLLTAPSTDQARRMYNGSGGCRYPGDNWMLIVAKVMMASPRTQDINIECWEDGAGPWAADVTAQLSLTRDRLGVSNTTPSRRMLRTRETYQNVEASTKACSRACRLEKRVGASRSE